MARDQVHRITTARRPHSVDISVRMRNYAISMGIRTACVICVAVVDHWTRWLFVPAAVFLPYVAVLFANAGRERVPTTPAALVADTTSGAATSGAATPGTAATGDGGGPGDPAGPPPPRRSVEAAAPQAPPGP